MVHGEAIGCTNRCRVPTASTSRTDPAHRAGFFFGAAMVQGKVHGASDDGGREGGGHRRRVASAQDWAKAQPASMAEMRHVAEKRL